MRNKIRITAAAGPRDIALIAGLARQIWTEHYTPIIGAAQVEYMLGRFQSQSAIKKRHGKRRIRL